MYTSLLVCIGDGDNIGDTIELYLLSGNLEEASLFSFKVKAVIEKIADLVQDEMKATLIYAAGDDICFIVPADINLSDKLEHYSNLFYKTTEKTISFGVGRDSVEALICLRKAKVSGKGRIVVIGGKD